jgi:hypothetical protein
MGTMMVMADIWVLPEAAKCGRENV